jgi:hypothetical protein
VGRRKEQKSDDLAGGEVKEGGERKEKGGEKEELRREDSIWRVVG